MALTAGAKLGPYEILGALGAKEVKCAAGRWWMGF